MIPAEEPALLDSNVLVHLIRGDRVGARIASDNRLRERTDRPFISIVTMGELKSLALKLRWGEAKQRRLLELASELVVVNLNQGDIIDRYAQIDHFSERVQKPARPMSKNDVWIAATASALGAHLLTMDADFDHLNPAFIKLQRVNAATGAPLP